MKDGSTRLTCQENSSHTFYSAWASHLCAASEHAASGQFSFHKLWDKVHIDTQACLLIKSSINDLKIIHFKTYQYELFCELLNCCSG